MKALKALIFIWIVRSSVVPAFAYSLFNPVPKDQMREFESGRPGPTDSARTVDAGHFQIETEVFGYTYHHTVTTTDRTYSFNNINLIAGLTNSLDLQLGVDTYIHQITSSQSGVGDLLPRLRYNITGNDSAGKESGNLAVAIIIAVKVPSGTGGLGNGYVEPGLSVPISFDLPAGFSASLMTTVSKNIDDDHSKYHTEVSNGMVLDHTIVGTIDGFIQFSGMASNQSDSAWVAGSGFGFTFRAGRDLQLDTGLNLGLTEGADDYNPYVGITVRF